MLQKWIFASVGLVSGVLLANWVSIPGLTPVIPYSNPFTYNQTITLNDESNYLINAQLDQLLNLYPGAARTRVGIIHSGPHDPGSTWLPSLRFDVTNVRATPGHDAGPAVSDLPLSQWGDYMPVLIAGKCVKVLVSDMHEDAAIQRFKVLNSSGFISCPINGPNGNLIGGLFMYWDYPVYPPEINVVEVNMRSAIKHIYSAIDLRSDTIKRQNATP